MKKTTKLEVIDTLDKNASIFQFKTQPCYRGDENEDLLCGGCSVVLAQDMSLASLSRSLIVAAQFIIDCPKCGAHNRVPAKAGN